VNGSVEEIGIGFIVRAFVSPVMKQSAPVRKELRVRTIFTLWTAHHPPAWTRSSSGSTSRPSSQVPRSREARPQERWSFRHRIEISGAEARSRT